jgi:protocatechuate 3,4-dioxygenase beta subunit
MKLGIVVLLFACDAAASPPPEVLVGGPCEGCEAVFEGRPAKLAASARIGSPDEPGSKLVIEGVVLDAARRPVAGVIVYAYHTDATGFYPSSPTGTKHRHGRLRGFALTDRAGKYRFDTVRPAGYPKTDIPEHVHMHVIEPNRCHYYLDDIVFTDDPRLTAAQRKAHMHGRGGFGVATPTRDKARTWSVRRDITLGAGISDYERCAKR